MENAMMIKKGKFENFEYIVAIPRKEIVKS
jgi:hypothetical protein